jgi:ABC-type glycerol-3-phosphate transport system permease component
MAILLRMPPSIKLRNSLTGNENGIIDSDRDYGLLMAASTMVTLPVILVFFLAQKYFIQGVTLTGMKA